MSIDEILELEMRNVECKTKLAIDEAHRKNRADLLSLQITILSEHTKVIAMAALSGGVK